MRFFHVYNEECYKGLEKNGLLNKDTAFKIQHCFSVPHERQFNNIAAIGGVLHSMIKENKIPFYVDRIAGGATYYKYTFDKNLIHEYENILGDWFLGFQLHESASNRRNSDWKTLVKHFGENGPYDIKEMDKVLLEGSYAITPYGEVLHRLSQGSIEEYSKLRYPKNFEDFYEDAIWMFKTRMAETDNHILPCDSYYVMTKLQDELGMKSFMPEVGAQIPCMRDQIAVARGLAKASGKTWGTYYECWIPSYDESGAKVYTMPCFNSDPINEWYLAQENHGDDFSTYGENGGSSRLLQNRIYYHALMSGADYFSEEWGLNCSYYDMKDFELSPYGETKKAFINDALKLQGIKSETPFALVLPKKFGTLEIRDIFEEAVEEDKSFKYMGYNLSAEDEKYLKHINKVRDLIFASDEEKFGNEAHVIKNSRFGDVFDIVYEDTNPEALKKYSYLVDATPDSIFAKASRDIGYRVLESTDIGWLEAQLTKLIREELPVYVDGLCWLVSTDCEGKRYLSIFNNDGNERSISFGNRIDNSYDRTVEVSFKNETEIKVIKEGNFPSEISRKDGKTYSIRVPAIAFIILEF